MTIGQLNEMLLNLLCCQTGNLGDGTMFRGTSIEYISEQLAAAGYEAHGKTKLHSGFTGEAYDSLVFMAPCYYQRLRHMSSDKDHARARGPVHMLSRQPTEGRARDGGLRFGEMERDCFDEATHQVLTSEGFLFLRDLEERRASGREVLIGAFDALADTLVYQPMTELVVNEARARTWVHIEPPAEASRWGSDAGKDGKSAHSNQVSLVVTEKHIMYAQSGAVRARADGGEYIAWSGQETRGEGKSRAFVHEDFKERTAGEMCQAGPGAAFRLRAAPSNGMSLAEMPWATLAPLGIDGPEKLSIFLEVYGYWLGDGSLQFRAGCGTDAVAFSVVKEADIEWILPALAKLTSSVRTYGVDDDQYQKRILVTDSEWVALFHGLYRSKYVLGAEDARRPSTLAARAKKESGQRKSPIGPKSAKWFAPFVWALPRDAARDVLRGLQRADGCWKTRSARIFTSSTAFRDEIVRLCLHAGYAPRMLRLYEAGACRGTSRAGTPIVAQHDGWQVSFADAAKRSAYGQPVIRASDMRRVVGHGRSWCVVVPSGFVITRRALVDEATGVVTQASVPIVVHNCLISHGAAEFLVDRLLDASDPSMLTLCGTCGLLAQPAAEGTHVRHKESFCKNCGSGASVYDMRSPFAFRLLLQELAAMHVAVRFEFEDEAAK
jgi:DNA-directed RNA polymerase II subunit RPB2